MKLGPGGTIDPNNNTAVLYTSTQAHQNAFLRKTFILDVLPGGTIDPQVTLPVLLP